MWSYWLVNSIAWNSDEINSAVADVVYLTLRGTEPLPKHLLAASQSGSKDAEVLLSSVSRKLHLYFIVKQKELFLQSI